jgi:transcriptional regulator GlxA family with amidase domain
MPLTTIASETGFCDTASFTSAFEQRYNMSPQQHRSQT